MSVDWGAVARDLPGDVPTPALVIDEAAARRNIAATAAAVAASGRVWRPHVKTARTAWGIGLLREAGVPRFKAATFGEAEALARAGAEDVLLAYPAVGPLPGRLAELAERHPRTRFSALVDDADALRFWPRGSRLAAMIDLDTGMGRTGVAAERVDAIEALADALDRRGVPLAGLHSYDGHLAALPPGRRAEEVRREAAALAHAAEAVDAPEVVAGATHTLLETVGTPASGGRVHSVGAGTVVYGDGRSLARFAEDGRPAAIEAAAVVVGRVVSVRPRGVTVDAGATAIQTDAGSPHAEPLVPRGLSAGPLSQEHLVLRGDPAGLRAGDPVVLLPRHIDTALSQFGTVLVRLEGGGWRRDAVVGRH